MTSVPDRARVRLTGISSRAYEHPADRAATAALARIPMLDQVVRTLIEYGYERALRQVFLAGSIKLGSDQLPEGVAELLRAFPFDFLYGSIAADSSIAKKYAPVGRHCHSWNVGLEIRERARADERLKAFALGYLAHLAAEGQTNQEIGGQLFLSPRTVEWHLRKVFTKLGISSRMGLHDALPRATAPA